MNRKRIVKWVAYFVGMMVCFFIGTYVSLLCLVGMLGVLVVQGILLSFLKKSIVLTMDCPEYSKRGQEITVRIGIAYPNIVSVMVGSYELEIKNTFVGETKRIQSNFLIHSEKSKEILIHAKSSYCGQVTYCMGTLILTDRMGLFERKISPHCEISTVVLPNLRPLTPALEVTQTISDEIQEIRPYVAGDDMRRIHWKMTAKLDEMMVREWKEPKHNEVYLLYETATLTTQPKPSKQEKNDSYEFFYSLGCLLQSKGYEPQVVVRREDGTCNITDYMGEEDRFLQTLQSFLSNSPFLVKEDTLHLFLKQEHDATILYVTPYHSKSKNQGIVFDADDIKRVESEEKITYENSR